MYYVYPYNLLVLYAHQMSLDGENVPVTSENKEEYVKLYVDYVLNQSCASQMDAFKDGFLKVVNKQVLQLFQLENWDVRANHARGGLA